MAIDECSTCYPFNCDCVCAECDEPADTERDDGNKQIVKLCSECAAEEN